jgi:hypothetical protein
MTARVAVANAHPSPIRVKTGLLEIKNVFILHVLAPINVMMILEIVNAQNVLIAPNAQNVAVGTTNHLITVKVTILKIVKDSVRIIRIRIRIKTEILPIIIGEMTIVLLPIVVTEIETRVRRFIPVIHALRHRIQETRVQNGA